MKYEPTPQEYAAIYARKSTKADNNSIQAQKSLAMDVINKEGLLLYKHYSDVESATKFEPIHRVGFKELMHDAMEGKFKTLVVFRRDRLARRASHLIEIKKFFKKYNIRIIYSNEGEFQPDDSYISNFIENIIMAVDELEPRILSERIESGKLKQRELGVYSSGRSVPFGYSREPMTDSIEYVCIPEEIEFVKRIFIEYINNNSISVGMKKLNKEIIEYKTLKNKKKYDETKNIKYLKPVPDVIIVNIIRNHVYASLQFKNYKLKVTSEDIFNIKDATNPTIKRELFQKCSNVQKAIDGDMWYKAAEKWKTSSLKRNGDNCKVETQIFKNLLFCDCCKEKIWFTTNDFKCKKGCFTISKDVAVNKILFTVLIKLVEDERFITILKNKIDALAANINTFEKKLSKESIEIKNRIIKMVFDGKSSEEALTKFFNNEHETIKKLEVIKMKRMDLIYLRDNIKSLVISPKVITDLKENQDYLQKMLKNLVKKVDIGGNEKQTRIIITFE